MISGLCKEGWFDDVIVLLCKKEENGCLSNVVTFETIFHAPPKESDSDNSKKLPCEIIARGLW